MRDYNWTWGYVLRRIQYRNTWESLLTVLCTDQHEIIYKYKTLEFTKIRFAAWPTNVGNFLKFRIRFENNSRVSKMRLMYTKSRKLNCFSVLIDRCEHNWRGKQVNQLYHILVFISAGKSLVFSYNMIWYVANDEPIKRLLEFIELMWFLVVLNWNIAVRTQGMLQKTSEADNTHCSAITSTLAAKINK